MVFVGLNTPAALPNSFSYTVNFVQEKGKTVNLGTVEAMEETIYKKVYKTSPH